MGRNLIYRLVTSWLMVAMILNAAVARAGEAPMIRGASLNNPWDGRWPFEIWNNATPTPGKKVKDEVHEYFHRFQSLHVNAVRKLIWGGNWNAAAQESFCEFLDLAQEHKIKVFIWLSFKVPSEVTYGDPAKALWQRADNPALFDETVQKAKADADKIVGYVAAHRPKHPAIIGWSIGNGENPWFISNAEFVRELAPYVRKIDPWHPVGMEAYTTSVSFIDGQIMLLPSTNGNAEIERRNVYPVLDYIGFANYDLVDGKSRNGIAWGDAFYRQAAAQNPENKPLILEEYGNTMNKDCRATFHTQLWNSRTGPIDNWQASFIWDAHARWFSNPIETTNLNFGLFTFVGVVEEFPFNLGPNKPFSNVFALRHAAHPWASYTFEDKTDPAKALDNESLIDLKLMNGAAKGAGHTGRGLVLDGVDDYATAPGDAWVMSYPFLNFEAWVKPAGGYVYGGLAYRAGVFEIFTSADGRIHVWADTGSGWKSKGNSASAIAPGGWTRVAVSYDGRIWRFTLNGKQDGKFEDKGALSPRAGAALEIGKGAAFFRGSLDEIQIGPMPSALLRLACDESAGATLADRSGNGLDAACQGGVTHGEQMLPEGKCAEFDGTSGYATIAGAKDLATGQVALSLYLRANDATPLQDILSQGQRQPGSGWGLYLEKGELTFAVNLDQSATNGFEGVLKVPYPADKGWHHVWASYDGKKLRLALDGTEQTALADGPIVHRVALDLTLARQAAAGTDHYFNGALDEVEVYSTGWQDNRPARQDVATSGTTTDTAAYK